MEEIYKLVNRDFENPKFRLKILLTGGAGFIGSHIAEKYCSQGHEVIIVDNLSTGKLCNLAFKKVENLRLIRADITDINELEKISKEFGPFDVINHQAAHVSVSESMNNPHFDIETNIIGTLNVLSISKGCKRFIFASSGGTVYGESSSPRHVGDPTNPGSIYGISKLACEKLVLLKANEYNFKPYVLRYANVYGPRQTPHGEAGVVSIFMDNLIKETPCKINGDGEYIRDYVHVYDVVNVNNWCTTSNRFPDIMNVSTGKPITTNRVYDIISKALKENGIIENPSFYNAPHREGDIRYSCCFPYYMFEKTIDFEEGIQITIQEKNCSINEAINACDKG